MRGRGESGGYLGTAALSMGELAALLVIEGPEENPKNVRRQPA